VIEILVDGLDHPEGVCWDPGAGVVWTGGEAGQVYRVRLEERRAEEVARAPGFVHGLAVDGRGRLVLCCRDESALCVLDDGSVRTIDDGFTFPNFPAFAPDGTLYVSDSGSWGASDGRVFRLSPDGELELFSAALTDFPNGCAVTADGRYLWIVESRRRP
jgi:gluconolactonase